MPAVVARHERSLGRGQRDVELALGVLAVDEQRPGETDRHLRDADEVLDVARRACAGIERVAADVLERGAGLLAGELPPGLRRLVRVVVLATRAGPGCAQAVCLSP